MKNMKIGDSVEEQTPELVRSRLRSQRTKAIIIVVVISLIIGLTTFLVSNSIFNKKEPVEENNSTISVDDENVKILYNYVTYGTKGQRNDKFVRNTPVNLSSFTNEEKFYYALKFADPDDLEFTGEVNEQKQKVYNISDRNLKKYMQQFFGPQVTYSDSIELSYPFTFTINSMNVGNIKYNPTRGGFDVVFTSFYDEEKEKPLVDDVYGELVDAKEDQNGNIILQEKIIYTKLTKTAEGVYTLEVYKDGNYEILLERRTNQTEEQLSSTPIDISKYTNTSIIEYTFATYNSTYYFQSSNIKL